MIFKKKTFIKYCKLNLLYMSLCVLSIIFISPFIWQFFTSLKTGAEVFLYPPRLLPKIFHWDNYLKLLDIAPFGLFLSNSFKIGVLFTIGQLLSCSLAAFAFARMKFPGRSLLFLLILSTLMIPYQLRMIPIFVLMKKLGWVNTHKALIVPGFFGSAFGIFLLRQFFLTFPQELEDVARLDGCSSFSIYWRIFLPLSKPVLATLGIFVFMTQWNDLLGPAIFLHSWEKMTVTIGLAAFQGSASRASPHWNLLMGGALLSIIPILIIYVVGQKYFVRGIVTTGLKG